jgi:transcription antitermination protein NusB
MLNRRTLRIKIMQSLFAFEQCKEANYQLALDQIEEHFQPDLNSMEFQDKELLKGQRKMARQLLERKFNKGESSDSDDPKVNAAVKEGLALYHKSVKKDNTFFSKNMVLEVEKLNDHYLSLLGLLISLADSAATDKKTDFKNFIENAGIKSLRENQELTKALLKTNGNWSTRQNLVKDWFREIVKSDDEFLKFNVLKTPSLEEQKSLLKHLIRKVILGKTVINDFFEEEDMRWAEDKEIVKSLAEKTIKSISQEGKVEIQKLSLDWEDDREFMKALFHGAVDLDEKHKELISQNTKNWEVDRLPLTDRVILEMAIAELIQFPNIPVKVSINEYIELAKHYSTPKSRQFINGILDVIAKELKSSGVLKKSGRGLIDNK